MTILTTAPAFAERYLLSPELVAEPYGHLDALRAHAPVHWSPLHHAWLVTGYDQVMRCLRDPRSPPTGSGP